MNLFCEPRSITASGYSFFDSVHSSDGKALLDHSQALPSGMPLLDTAAMDSKDLAAKFAVCFPKGGKIRDVDITKELEVTKQTVNSWRKTGRIAKKHLPGLAKLSRRPLGWWLGDTSETRSLWIPPEDRIKASLDELAFTATQQNRIMLIIEEIKDENLAIVNKAMERSGIQLPRTADHHLIARVIPLAPPLTTPRQPVSKLTKRKDDPVEPPPRPPVKPKRVKP